MSRKTEGQQRRNREQRGLLNPPPKTDPAPPKESRSERRLEEQALRNGWLTPEDRGLIVAKFMDIIEEDETYNSLGLPVSNTRYQAIVGKTLIQADQKERIFAFQRDKFAATQVADAETASEETEQPKRIIIPDVDDRIPRED